jgi:two-component system sensor histidine kinase KdpD
VPEQATHALQAFFSPSNLTALRELAMQTAADRVDMTCAKRRRHAAFQACPCGGRYSSPSTAMASPNISCASAAAWPSGAMRHGRSSAVQTGAHLDTARQREIDEAFALARRLGGDAEPGARRECG